MIISRTPLRISFVGGGTDIDTFYRNDYGAVVNATINKYIYVTVHKRFDSSIRVSYTKTEIVYHAEDLKHDIVKACLQMAGIKDGIEITTIGEVPGGTGLGSSSSLTVGLLNALYTYKGEQLSTDELLKKACQIEIDVLKSPIGKQDQSAAVFGGINYIRFNSDESIEHDKLELTDSDYKALERRLMMFYTGIQRSANEVLTEQKKKTPTRLETLRSMRDQADEMRELLLHKENICDQFAAMLHAGWQKKRSITEEISNSVIDELYAKALDAGAMGGKLLGAGGGGFLLLYCEEAKQQHLREALGLKELDFGFTRYGSSIVYFG